MLFRSLPAGGRLITLEYDPKHAAVAQANIAQANLAHAGLADRVEIRIGPALDTLPKLLAEGRTDLDALRRRLDAGPITLYCGFDPTAPSLHLGNLAQILTVRRFQQHGHRPLALVGGATGLIGDPKMTGERQLNDADTVGGWVERKATLKISQ